MKADVVVALIAASAAAVRDVRGGHWQQRQLPLAAVGWGEARRGVYTYSARKKTKCGGREGAAGVEASSNAPTAASSIAAAPAQDQERPFELSIVLQKIATRAHRWTNERLVETW